MRNIALGFLAATVLLMGIMIFRFERETQAMIIGVLLGMGAGGMSCLLLIWALGRRSQPVDDGGGHRGRDDSKVIVINPPAGAGYFPPYREGPALAPPAGARQYTAIGDEFEEGAWHE